MENGYFAHPTRASKIAEEDRMVLFGIDFIVVQAVRLGDQVVVRLEPAFFPPADRASRTVELRLNETAPVKVFYKDR